MFNGEKISEKNSTVSTKGFQVFNRIFLKIFLVRDIFEKLPKRAQNHGVNGFVSVGTGLVQSRQGWLTARHWSRPR